MSKTIKFLLPILFSSIVIFSTLLARSSSVFATSVASPPNSTDLVGVWIGYSEANGEFIRIELKPDMTGVCAVVPSPATLGAQPSDVDVYPINRWHSTINLSALVIFLPSSGKPLLS